MSAIHFTKEAAKTLKVFTGNFNPSRGWFWWSIGEQENSPLINGTVFHSEAAMLADARAIAKKTGLRLA